MQKPSVRAGGRRGLGDTKGTQGWERRLGPDRLCPTRLLAHSGPFCPPPPPLRPRLQRGSTWGPHSYQQSRRGSDSHSSRAARGQSPDGS